MGIDSVSMDSSPYRIFQALSEQDSAWVSMDTLQLLYRHARTVAEQGAGIIVEIGAHCSAFTIALALGVKHAGRGQVISIPYYRNHSDKHDRLSSSEVYQADLESIKRYGVESQVSHRSDSAPSVKDWNFSIDLLWINEDDSYARVSEAIHWTARLRDLGLVIFGNHAQGSEMAAAIGDHLPFSHYRLMERAENAVVFHKQEQPRKLYLCGGMQSSGSTLVSWCFLQRSDLDGVYDMENALIHQDFSRVRTESVWIKMTIGAFRLAELVELYRAQGWEVRPLLIQRDLEAVIGSLRNKDYGIDGATGDDPPLYIRVQRYLADLEQARVDGWPVLIYEELMANPVTVLERACSALNLLWEESMTAWSKPESAIAYMSVGSPSLRETRRESGDLLSTIARYRQQMSSLPQAQPDDKDPVIRALKGRVKSAPGYTPSEDIGMKEPVHSLLPPAAFRGTRRQRREQIFIRLHQGYARLYRNFIRQDNDRRRLARHVVFGSLIKLWRRFINPSFPAFEHYGDKIPSPDDYSKDL